MKVKPLYFWILDIIWYSALLLCWFTAEVAMLENNIIVYKFVQDLHFFVTGGDEENELILANVLQGLFDAVSLLLRF